MLYFRAEYQINSVKRQRANTTCVTTITNNRDGGIGSSDFSRSILVIICFGLVGNERVSATTRGLPWFMLASPSLNSRWRKNQLGGACVVKTA